MTLRLATVDFCKKMLDFLYFFARKVDSKLRTTSHIVDCKYVGEPSCIVFTLIQHSHYSFWSGQSWHLFLACPFFGKIACESLPLSSHKKRSRTNFWNTKTDPKPPSQDLSIDICFDSIGRGRLKPPQGGGDPHPKKFEVQLYSSTWHHE